MDTPDLLFRIGHGYDLHRLEPRPPAGRGRPFVLAGLAVDHPDGPVGHSDGDAVLHAVTDALLGAIGADDLGTLFPDDDPRHESADSARFLAVALERVHAAGYVVGNLDVTVICERPRIAPLRASLRERLAELLGCVSDHVNIKGKTHEGLDAIGEGRAIEVHAVCLLRKETA